MPQARVGLSTASVYPENCATAFETAARLGYDGVEVMVWTDPVTREAGALLALAELQGVPVLSVHAPTLLITQRVWGTDPWEKVDRSIELALEVGADTVILHPPFRWQREYARGFVDGVALREHDSGIRLAVENMYPWRAPRSRELEAYLPTWDPVPQPYDHVTLDLSHTATAGSDAMGMTRLLGPRLTHLHLADGPLRQTFPIVGDDANLHAGERPAAAHQRHRAGLCGYDGDRLPRGVQRPPVDPIDAVALPDRRHGHRQRRLRHAVACAEALLPEPVWREALCERLLAVVPNRLRATHEHPHAPEVDALEVARPNHAHAVVQGEVRHPAHRPAMARDRLEEQARTANPLMRRQQHPAGTEQDGTQDATDEAEVV